LTSSETAGNLVNFAEITSAPTLNLESTMTTQNNTKSLSLTLSRWHSVAERLQSKARELATRAVATLSGTAVSGYQEQEDVLRASAKEALADLGRSRALQVTVGQIRAALGKANQEQGVNESLARLQVLNRDIQLLSQLAGIDVTQQVSVDALKSVFEARAARTAVNHGYDRGVTVAMLSREDVKAYRVEIERLQSQAHGLSDSINDKNREKITLAIDEDSAQVAGL
jgi:hypothetical protein